MDLKKKVSWHFKVDNLVLILRKTMKILRRLMTPDEIWRQYPRLKIRKHLIHTLGVPQLECGLALDQLSGYEYSEYLEPNYTFKTERSWHIPFSRSLRCRAEVEIIQSLYLIPMCEKSVLYPKQYNWLVTGLHLLDHTCWHVFMWLYELVSTDPDSTVFNHVINCSKKAQETIFVIMTAENWLAHNKIIFRFQNCELILMQTVSVVISLSTAAGMVSNIECRPSMRWRGTDKRNKLYSPK